MNYFCDNPNCKLHIESSEITMVLYEPKENVYTYHKPDEYDTDYKIYSSYLYIDKNGERKRYCNECLDIKENMVKIETFDQILKSKNEHIEYLQNRIKEFEELHKLLLK